MLRNGVCREQGQQAPEGLAIPVSLSVLSSGGRRDAQPARAPWTPGAQGECVPLAQGVQPSHSTVAAFPVSILEWPVLLTQAQATVLPKELRPILGDRALPCLPPGAKHRLLPSPLLVLPSHLQNGSWEGQSWPWSTPGPPRDTGQEAWQLWPQATVPAASPKVSCQGFLFRVSRGVQDLKDRMAWMVPLDQR